QCRNLASRFRARAGATRPPNPKHQRATGGATARRAAVTIAPRLALDAGDGVREGECANPARTLSHAAGLVRHRVGPPPQRSDPTRQHPWTWHGRVHAHRRACAALASVERRAAKRTAPAEAALPDDAGCARRGEPLVTRPLSPIKDMPDIKRTEAFERW